MREMKLRNDVRIPGIGLGTWQITDRDRMAEVVDSACRSGYRLFDTAAAYSNEIALGKALRNIRVQREELFIQDKLWITCYGYEEAQAACRKSLRKLKLDYLDAYLLHWPASPGKFENWQEVNADTWRGMEQLYKDGYVRSIGVCNFNVQQLEELCRTAAVEPFINQVEFHPGMFCQELLSYCETGGIRLEAASPLGNGRILENEVLAEIAEKKKITAAQLCLAWAMQHGCIVIPKTVRARYLSENMQSGDIRLDRDEMDRLDRLPYCGGLAADMDEVMNFEGT